MTGAAFRVFAIGAMLGAALFLVAPLAIIAAASFSPTPVFDLPVGGASLRWYAAVGSLEGFWPALTLSLEVALLSTAVSLVLGTLAGIAIARGAMPGAQAFAAACGFERARICSSKEGAAISLENENLRAHEQYADPAV